MGISKNEIIDDAALRLLALGGTVSLGMPAYAIRTCVFRMDHPLPPEDIVGLGEEGCGTSILEDYERRYGYHFSWGTLSEYFSDGADDEDGRSSLSFEFTPRDVFLSFPDGWHLWDLFAWLYRWHPLRHRKFPADPDDVSDDWSVIRFNACGISEIRLLRSWLGDVFIPLIWPDLLSEAMKIIREKKVGVTSPVAFEKLLANRDRWMLCEKPKSLSFYKRR